MAREEMTKEEANQRASIMRDDIRGVLERIIVEHNNLDLSNEASVFELIYDRLVNEYKEEYEDKRVELEVLNGVNQQFKKGEVKFSDIGIDISAVKKSEEDAKKVAEFLKTGGGTYGSSGVGEQWNDDGKQEKDSVENDKKKLLEILDQMIGYIKDHFDSMINGDMNKGQMLNDSLVGLVKMKNLYEQNRLNNSDCLRDLCKFNSKINDKFGHDILDYIRKNNQNNHNHDGRQSDNNEKEDKRKINDTIDFMIDYLQNECSGFKVKKNMSRGDFIGALNDIKKSLNDGYKSVSECGELLDEVNQWIIEDFKVDLLEKYRFSIAKNNSISINNIHNYNDLLVTVNNYIKLMDEKRSLALRSCDAVEKGRDSQESRGKYDDLLRELRRISRAGSNKNVGLEELVRRLSVVANELKKDYDLNLSMIQTTKSHRVVKIRKGTIRRVLGVTASNALFMAGLIQIPQLITFFNLYGYTYNIGLSTLKVAACVVVPIVTDILLKCSNKKELLIISHILNKIRNGIKNNEVENKRGARK